MEIKTHYYLILKKHIKIKKTLEISQTLQIKPYNIKSFNLKFKVLDCDKLNTIVLSNLILILRKSYQFKLLNKL